MAPRSCEQPLLDLFGDERFPLSACHRQYLAAFWAVGDAKHALDVLSDGANVANDRGESR